MIAEPLYALKKKKVKWKCTEICNKAFNDLKDCLVTPAVLGHPDFSVLERMKMEQMQQSLETFLLYPEVETKREEGRLQNLDLSLPAGEPSSACIVEDMDQLEEAANVRVITAVVLVLICLLVVIMRYLYQHKGTYHTNEAKGTEFAENADAALKCDPSLQEAVDESKKEYFI
ncbi:GLPC protein, partial [Polyodon spathula]|nr:GLPC protein [Polyodon spathula]